MRFIELDGFDNEAAAFGRKLSQIDWYVCFIELDGFDNEAAAFGRKLSQIDWYVCFIELDGFDMLTGGLTVS